MFTVITLLPVTQGSKRSHAVDLRRHSRKLRVASCSFVSKASKAAGGRAWELQSQTDLAQRSGRGTEIDGFSMQRHRCVLQFFHEQRQICGVCEKEFVPDFLSYSSVLFFFFFLQAGWREL